MSTDFVIDIVKRLAPDLTETQTVAAAARARAKALENGGGIAQLYADAEKAGGTFADAVVKEAIRETLAVLKAKGETDVTESELAKLEKQRLCFGKAGADAPLKHRGEYTTEYGQADFDTALKIWGASMTDLTPRKNPYSKPIRKAMRAAREGTLEATPFNLAINPDQVKAPKPPKLTPEQLASNPWSAAGWNLTRQSQAYKANPVEAQRLMAQVGARLGDTRPNR